MNQHHRLFVLAAGLVDNGAALKDRFLDYGLIAERRGGGFGLGGGRSRAGTGREPGEREQRQP
jgi:hypothetical protein